MTELSAYAFKEEYCAEVSYLTSYYILINVRWKCSLCWF